jgi:uncharacterized PurR-regulated membrane protein YhhQ (DUF165 family)
MICVDTVVFTSLAFLCSSEFPLKIYARFVSGVYGASIFELHVPVLGGKY